MRYRSAFDIIGPAMVGPSSSHTAGANRIGQVARQLHGRPLRMATIVFYGSFAETYSGHGTDRAIVAGLLGMKADDIRIRNALDMAVSAGLYCRFEKGALEGVHPNSVRIKLVEESRITDVVGISLGGGKIEIIEFNGYDIRFSGEFSTLVVEHVDQVGVVGRVAGLIAECGINISHMEVDRHERGGRAMAIIEMDQRAPDPLINKIQKIPFIQSVRQLEAV